MSTAPTNTFVITIDGSAFPLAHNVDVAGVEEEIIALVRAGGGMAKLHLEDGTTVAALVTPHLPVFVSLTSAVEAETTGVDSSWDAALVDVDDYAM